MPPVDPRTGPYCRPGERPLVSVVIRYVEGREVTGVPPGSWAEEAASWALQTGGPRTEGAADRLLIGTSLQGWPGCWAEGLRDVVDGGGIGVELTLPDRRLLVLPFGEGDDLLWTAERHQVAGVRRAPRPLQRGRVRLDLADGSMLMVVTGMLATRSARRLVAAW